MSSLILPILAPAPLLYLILAKPFWAFYTNLHDAPMPLPKPSPLQRLRYELHKIYFNYLVTGPGYVLQPVERVCLDCGMLTLIGALLYGLFVFLANVPFPGVTSALNLTGAFSRSWKHGYIMGIDLNAEDIVLGRKGMNQYLA
ncbi:hypothetical protein AOQ84DRAFT_382613 [Glonium stellatum]|uniref:Uncharacterized protein n=1 Tax=Glonium stellatum TaxID=574774 RepID=A0A8E2JM66_9PEZI|nr:hypothetical protein AOQ84DRAFT_382613 [Glonium stellatum]